MAVLPALNIGLIVAILLFLLVVLCLLVFIPVFANTDDEASANTLRAIAASVAISTPPTLVITLLVVTTE